MTEGKDGMWSAVSKMLERLDIVFAIGGLGLLFLGFFDAASLTSIKLRPVPAWNPVNFGAGLVALSMVTMYIHGRRPELIKALETKPDEVLPTVAASYLHPPPFKGDPKSLLYGHHATIFLLRHIAEKGGYCGFGDYSYALYWWHVKKQNGNPTQEEFLLKREGWDQASRYAFRYLSMMELVETTPECCILQKGRLLLQEPEFRAKNADAFSPKLVA